jgi:hypothetical protein
MSHVHGTASPYEPLRIKLLRELFQAERETAVHPAREARRLGASPPGIALRALAKHGAVALNQLSRISAHGRGMRSTLGRLVGESVSLARYLVVDRVIDAERSYRATLLGLKHGLDLIRLLHEVAERDGDVALALWCEDTLIARESLVEDAERALAWYAAEPLLAVRSGAALALH